MYWCSYWNFCSSPSCCWYHWFNSTSKVSQKHIWLILVSNIVQKYNSYFFFYIKNIVIILHGGMFNTSLCILLQWNLWLIMTVGTKIQQVWNTIIDLGLDFWMPKKWWMQLLNMKMLISKKLVKFQSKCKHFYSLALT